jgi:hypothetical protein
MKPLSAICGFLHFFLIAFPTFLIVAFFAVVLLSTKHFLLKVKSLFKTSQ